MASVALLLAGCAATPGYRPDEWRGAQNCHFSHVSKRDFETAMRRVFDASRPKAYGLRPAEGGALVEQHWTLDVVFASARGVERWRVEYAPAGDGVDVHAEVEHVPGESTSLAGKGMPLADGEAGYQLLWSRLDYVLGNRADWPSCKTATERRHQSPVSLVTSGLCRTSSDAPPPRLARAR